MAMPFITQKQNKTANPYPWSRIRWRSVLQDGSIAIAREYREDGRWEQECAEKLKHKRIKDKNTKYTYISAKLPWASNVGTLWLF